MGRHKDGSTVAEGSSEGLALDHETAGGLGAEPDEVFGLDTRWLYRAQEGVFGPVTAKELLELLYAASIDGQTLVGKEDGEFCELQQYAVFQPHLKRAHEVQQRRRIAEANALDALRSGRLQRLKWAMRLMLVAVLGALVLYGLVWGIRVIGASFERIRLQQRVEQEVEQLLASARQSPPALPDIPPEMAPPESHASPESHSPFIAEEHTSSPIKGNSVRRAVETKGKGQGKLASHTKQKRRERAKKAAERKRLSDQEVRFGMNRIFPQMVRCIRAQFRRDRKSVPNTIVLQFSITNQGRAANVELADRFLRRSPLQSCIISLLDTVHWRPYRGQIRNIEYPISVNKPK